MIRSRFTACFTFASVKTMKCISVTTSDANSLTRAGGLNFVICNFTDNVHERICFSYCRRIETNYS